MAIWPFIEINNLSFDKGMGGAWPFIEIDNLSFNKGMGGGGGMAILAV